MAASTTSATRSRISVAARDRLVRGGRAGARRRRAEDRRARQARALPAPEGLLRHAGRARAGLRAGREQHRPVRSPAPSRPRRCRRSASCRLGDCRRRSSASALRASERRRSISSSGGSCSSPSCRSVSAARRKTGSVAVRQRARRAVGARRSRREGALDDTRGRRRRHGRLTRRRCCPSPGHRDPAKEKSKAFALLELPFGNLLTLGLLRRRRVEGESRTLFLPKLGPPPLICMSEAFSACLYSQAYRALSSFKQALMQIFAVETVFRALNAAAASAPASRKLVFYRAGCVVCTRASRSRSSRPNRRRSMRLSRYFLPILRETPKEAEIVSHRLMLRAGMIRQEAAGHLCLAAARPARAQQDQRDRPRGAEPRPARSSS